MSLSVISQNGMEGHGHAMCNSNNPRGSGMYVCATQCSYSIAATITITDCGNSRFNNNQLKAVCPIIF